MTKQFALTGMLVAFLAAVAQAASTIPAEAEVSASSGPIKLTLSVYKTKVHLGTEYIKEMDWKKFEKDHPGKELSQVPDWKSYEHPKPRGIGDPIWIRLRVTNVGKKPISISDPLFTGREDFAEALGSNMDSKLSYYLEFVGPDGQPVHWFKFKGIDVGCANEQLAVDQFERRTFEELTPEEQAEKKRLDALGHKWHKLGYSREKMQALLEQETAKKSRKKTDEELIEEEKEARRKHPNKILAPGESVATKSFVSGGVCPEDRASLPSQIDDFAELWNFRVRTRGVYRIRAVHGVSTICDDLKKLSPKLRTLFEADCRVPRKHFDEDVVVQTPDILIHFEP